MSPLVLSDPDALLWHGDNRAALRALPAGSVDCVITSPPYYGLRDYGSDAQIGLEGSAAEYVTTLVELFAEVRRVLADHGNVWVNVGDTYSGSGGGPPGATGQVSRATAQAAHAGRTAHQTGRHDVELPAKSLMGMPWRVAFALQADGWILRRDVIWSKPNPMPESASDRCTSAHEYVFHLVKRGRYWYDADAIREPLAGALHAPGNRQAANGSAQSSAAAEPGRVWGSELGRNARSVWEIPTEPTPDAHFATYPQELVRRALLAGCPARVCTVCGQPSSRIVESSRQGGDWSAKDRLGRGRAPIVHDPGAERRTVGWTDCGHDAWRRGVVLDPFVGSGTTCLVARNHGRYGIGIDLSAEYLGIARRRLAQLSLLAEATP